MMIIKKVLSAALASAVMVSPMTAFAADLDNVVYADDANMLQSAELGSNWYIRGDIGLNFNGIHNVSTSSVDSVYDIQNIMDKTHVSAGVGYQINGFLRGEVNIGRLTGSDYAETRLLTLSIDGDPATAPVPGGTPTEYEVSNPCNGWREVVNGAGETVRVDAVIENCLETNSASYDTTYAMANLYADLGKFGRFSPFVGAGIGYGRVAWSQETDAIDCIPVSPDVYAEGCLAFGVAEQPAPNEQYAQAGTVETGVGYRLGYSLTAGVAYDLTQNLKLEGAYRYTAFGKADIDYADPATTGQTMAEAGFGIHQVNVGLRYSLW